MSMLSYIEVVFLPAISDASSAGFISWRKFIYQCRVRCNGLDLKSILKDCGYQMLVSRGNGKVLHLKPSTRKVKCDPSFPWNIRLVLFRRYSSITCFFISMVFFNLRLKYA